LVPWRLHHVAPKKKREEKENPPSTIRSRSNPVEDAAVRASLPGMPDPRAAGPRRTMIHMHAAAAQLRAGAASPRTLPVPLRSPEISRRFAPGIATARAAARYLSRPRFRSNRLDGTDRSLRSRCRAFCGNRLLHVDDLPRSDAPLRRWKECAPDFVSNASRMPPRRWRRCRVHRHPAWTGPRTNAKARERFLCSMHAQPRGCAAIADLCPRPRVNFPSPCPADPSRYRPIIRQSAVRL